MRDGVLEDSQAVGERDVLDGPGGVLGGADEAFGVRHQSEYSAGFIAEPGKFGGTAVGVGGKEAMVGVAQRELAAALGGEGGGGRIEDDASFAVRDGELVVASRLEECAALGSGVHGNPATLESVGLIGGD